MVLMAYYVQVDFPPRAELINRDDVIVMLILGASH